ncbi:hypothetical protein B0H15DRAFT_438237 [Mycena belliarum]|uniref:Uncharacterized protein n=1 Tax=Mycena belliarum TaxID=1033014 RepID=A0AAD6XLE2_9AGAR|nr:hypothetical protein B0H15DRAFT_438075 [Mycena belliae]KAJ7082729.1 hypothetical protein B0H15DRAFT_438237 [Mycena belliae]
MRRDTCIPCVWYLCTVFPTHRHLAGRLVSAVLIRLTSHVPANIFIQVLCVPRPGRWPLNLCLTCPRLRHNSGSGFYHARSDTIFGRPAITFKLLPRRRCPRNSPCTIPTVLAAPLESDSSFGDPASKPPRASGTSCAPRLKPQRATTRSSGISA